MKPVVYLHIGMNKTGTTAIQRFFNQQREPLKELGLLYPSTACAGEAHYALSRLLGFDHGKQAEVDVQGSDFVSLKRALRKEIESSAAQHVVMSSENFVLPRAVEPVKVFFAPYSVRIVVYLRRHDAWWESAYNQAVKMVVNPPWGRSFPTYLKFQKRKNPKFGSYRALVDRWANVFGKENIIVRPYESQQNKPDLVSDLLFAIGLETVARQMGAMAERTNESLSLLSLNLIDIYQRIEVNPEVRARLISNALSLPGGGSRVSLASPTLRRQLIEENMEDYQYIAKEYLGRDDGRLFYEALPNDNDPWDEPKHPTILAIVEETVKALAQ